MRITIIGGKGHVGTYLVPRLVELGHEVTSVSRGRREPYLPHAAWSSVRQVNLDREQLEAEGRFAEAIIALNPEAVIDMICFGPESALHLAQGLEGRVQHFLSCGTIWVHGPSVEVPTREEAPRAPFGEYGVRKAAMEAALLDFARRRGFPATVLHPGHIVGRGWVPLNPAGNFNPEVFACIARGQTLTLPNLGLEPVHHVHAHARACLRWEQGRRRVSEEDAASTWDHIAHSPCCSIDKARRVLGYQPRYSSLEAVTESGQWLREKTGVQA